jgi:hypothetical protein
MIFTAIFAFISVISFFQVNSAWADDHNFNTGWKVIGAITGLIAIYCLTKTAKSGGGGSSTGMGAR